MMCVSCHKADNYFHTAECVYDHLVKEYPVLWLQNSTRVGAYYICRQLLSPEGVVLAFGNILPLTGWRLRIWYNETTDEDIEPLREDMIQLLSRADALQAFESFRENVRYDTNSQ